jgi:hypothetical protein
MPFEPQQLRSALIYDGARPNLFEVRMAFPDLATGAIRAGGTDGLAVAQQFTMFCRAAELPGKTINPVPVPFQGREIKVPGNVQYMDWTVTCYSDEDWKLKSALELWQNAINGARSNARNTRFMAPVDYGRDMYVIHYSKDAVTPLKSYLGIGVWPMDIQPIALDWGQNDVILEYTVTFAIQWWEQTSSDQNGSGGLPPIRNVNLV